MSNKSLEFVKKRINSDLCKGVNKKTYDFMKELNFRNVVEKILHKEFGSDGLKMDIPLQKADSGTIANIGLKIVYDADANFQYFTIESCLCDGTLIFYNELVNRILNKLLALETCYKLTKPKDAERNLEKYNICYTVGNFVFASGNEHNPPKDKLWMNDRIAVMLPIKCEFIEKRLKNE